MLSQAHPVPLQLQIPRFIPDYGTTHISPLDRPKPSASQSYYTAAVVETSLSPVRSDSPRDNTDKGHRLPSPASPQENSKHFEIVRRSTGPFDSNICQADIYENSSTPSYSSQQHQPYSSAPGAPSSGFIINSASKLRGSDTVVHYLSDSPSPIDVQHPPSLSHPSSAPPSQDRFPHSTHPLYSGPDRTIARPNPNSELPSLEEMDKYPTLRPPSSLLDLRRMSEPALVNSNHAYHHDSATDLGSSARQPSLHYDYTKESTSSMYLAPALHRGASTGSLRDLRQQHYQYPPSNGGWKHDHSADRQYEQVSPLDEPLSPFQSNFNGGMASPTSGMPYSPVNDNFYGPSPPGTGTSTSSSGPMSAGLPSSLPHLSSFRSPHRSVGGPSHSPADSVDRKNYSFIALPGNAVKKRPRRRYDEIERLYQCSWPECAKAYGTLNHLNAHVTMQKHGSKRNPSEFKELRKQWRKAKKEADGHASMESLRRTSFSGSRDYDYDAARFAFSNSPQRTHLLDFPSSMSMNQSFNHGQYSDGMEDLRYNPYPREEHAYYAAARPSYEDGLPSSWQGPTPSASRSITSDYYTTSQNLQHSHLPQVMVTESGPHAHSIPMPPSPRRIVNRLPLGSTLLTPLPAYNVGPSMPMAIPTGVEHLRYSLDIGDSDNSRPSTGSTNSSAGFPSGEDYEPRL
ncbi:Zn finger family DNA binding protein [Ephemerocybe angulata]|uniref:Zn finger family DNA binding protein n=1 Tax=Ephemerocybe angulata TaxID=980116 RepID=A0A8H6ID54_9AGAR|nr:Zn finger family DNA binding protein [Tulosesus angulatus]